MADAPPVVVTHGWPGSVVEFHKVIGPLTDPAAHGGDPTDAFHLVIPSLPGSGSRDKPTAAGWGVERIAAGWATLMDRLGYGGRWAAQGGDRGAGVTRMIGAANPAGCVGLHLNMLPLRPTAAEIAAADDGERKVLADVARDERELVRVLEGAEHAAADGRVRAGRLAGRAGGVDVREVPRLDRQLRLPEDVLTRDEMLDNVMLYWRPDTAASSARLYWESFAAMREERPTVMLPTASACSRRNYSGGRGGGPSSGSRGWSNGTNWTAAATSRRSSSRRCSRARCGRRFGPLA